MRAMSRALGLTVGVGITCGVLVQRRLYRRDLLCQYQQLEQCEQPQESFGIMGSLSQFARGVQRVCRRQLQACQRLSGMLSLSRRHVLDIHGSILQPDVPGVSFAHRFSTRQRQHHRLRLQQGLHRTGWRRVFGMRRWLIQGGEGQCHLHGLRTGQILVHESCN